MTTPMTFAHAIDLYRSIYKRFSAIEQRPWGAEGAVIELTKQVGELARHIMVAEGYYYKNRPGYSAEKEGIGDELADILAQLIRLADHYEIDLVEAHIKARQAEDESLQKKGL
ncbi:MAG: hypothetical protein GKR89_12490 [Candidatus Latescibacteria bacterium]|nr:hypothetical protein [Candidatus Latescibacterota bacterium]